MITMGGIFYFVTLFFTNAGLAFAFTPTVEFVSSVLYSSLLHPQIVSIRQGFELVYLSSEVMCKLCLRGCETPSKKLEVNDTLSSPCGQFRFHSRHDSNPSQTTKAHVQIIILEGFHINISFENIQTMPDLPFCWHQYLFVYDPMIGYLDRYCGFLVPWNKIIHHNLVELGLESAVYHPYNVHGRYEITNVYENIMETSMFSYYVSEFYIDDAQLKISRKMLKIIGQVQSRVIITVIYLARYSTSGFKVYDGPFRNLQIFPKIKVRPNVMSQLCAQLSKSDVRIERFSATGFQALLLAEDLHEILGACSFVSYNAIKEELYQPTNVSEGRVTFPGTTCQIHNKHIILCLFKVNPSNNYGQLTPVSISIIKAYFTEPNTMDCLIMGLAFEERNVYSNHISVNVICHNTLVLDDEQLLQPIHSYTSSSRPVYISFYSYNVKVTPNIELLISRSNCPGFVIDNSLLVTENGATGWFINKKHQYDVIMDNGFNSSLHRCCEYVVINGLDSINTDCSTYELKVEGDFLSFCIPTQQGTLVSSEKQISIQLAHNVDCVHIQKYPFLWQSNETKVTEVHVSLSNFNYELAFREFEFYGKIDIGHVQVTEYTKSLYLPVDNCLLEKVLEREVSRRSIMYFGLLTYTLGSCKFYKSSVKAPFDTKVMDYIEVYPVSIKKSIRKHFYFVALEEEEEVNTLARLSLIKLKFTSDSEEICTIRVKLSIKDTVDGSIKVAKHFLDIETNRTAQHTNILRWGSRRVSISGVTNGCNGTLVILFKPLVVCEPHSKPFNSGHTLSRMTAFHLSDLVSMTWEEASAFCHQFGLSLFDLHVKDHESVLHRFLMGDFSRYKPVFGGGCRHIHNGDCQTFINLGKPEIGKHWVWMSSGNVVIKANWAVKSKQKVNIQYNYTRNVQSYVHSEFQRQHPIFGKVCGMTRYNPWLNKFEWLSVSCEQSVSVQFLICQEKRYRITSAILFQELGVMASKFKVNDQSNFLQQTDRQTYRQNNATCYNVTTGAIDAANLNISVSVSYLNETLGKGYTICIIQEYIHSTTSKRLLNYSLHQALTYYNNKSNFRCFRNYLNFGNDMCYKLPNIAWSDYPILPIHNVSSAEYLKAIFIRHGQCDRIHALENELDRYTCWNNGRNIPIEDLPVVEQMESLPLACPTECINNLFRCKGNIQTCLSSVALMDGEEDCSDGSDEDVSNFDLEFFYVSPIGAVILWENTNYFDPNITQATNDICHELDDGRIRQQNNETLEKALYKCKGSPEQVPRSWLNDLIPDCPLGDDEPSDAEYSDHPCIGHLQCSPGHPKCFEFHQLCIYDTDQYNHTRYCRNGAHLAHCESITCYGYFKCLDSYCIALWKICDGYNDCPHSEDEAFCTNREDKALLGANNFRCKNGNLVHQSHICDGITDCGEHDDDENGCYLADCNEDCRCLGLSMVCVNSTELLNVYGYKSLVRKNLGNDTFNVQNGEALIALNLSNNGIAFVSENLTQNVSNINFLDLSNNRIKNIMKNAFILLQRLLFLYLQGNVIQNVHDSNFIELHCLEIIDLSHQNLKSMPVSTQWKMNSSRVLNLSYNSLKILNLNLIPLNLPIRILDVKGNKLESVFYSAHLNALRIESDYPIMCCFTNTCPFKSILQILCPATYDIPFNLLLVCNIAFIGISNSCSAYFTFISQFPLHLKVLLYLQFSVNLLYIFPLLSISISQILFHLENIFTLHHYKLIYCCASGIMQKVSVYLSVTLDLCIVIEKRRLIRSWSKHVDKVATSVRLTISLFFSILLSLLPVISAVSMPRFNVVCSFLSYFTSWRIKLFTLLEVNLMIGILICCLVVNFKVCCMVRKTSKSLLEAGGLRHGQRSETTVLENIFITIVRIVISYILMIAILLNENDEADMYLSICLPSLLTLIGPTWKTHHFLFRKKHETNLDKF